jgi:hypothetical protein
VKDEAYLGHLEKKMALKDHDETQKDGQGEQSDLDSPAADHFSQLICFCKDSDDVKMNKVYMRGQGNDHQIFCSISLLPITYV